MADEEKLLFTSKGRFTIETRLIVACYICDKNDEEIEDPKDYAKKGKSLKIITEEFDQEIVCEPGRKRYYEPESEEIIYWVNNAKQYYGENVSTILVSRRNDTAIDLSMQRFIRGDVLRAVKVTDTIKESVVFNSKVNDYNNDNTVRISKYKPEILFQPEDIPGVIDPLYPDIIPDPITPPAYNLVLEDSPTTYYHLQVVDRFCTHDSFTESPEALVDKPDDCRKIPMVSEIYIRKFPSKLYIADAKTGLDAAINKLVRDPKITKYNLEKIIIAQHISIELRKFNPPLAYSIKNDTFKYLFQIFKKVEITNPAISIIFPPTEIITTNLIIKNCKIYANNSTIKLNSLILDNCTFYNNDDKSGPKSIVFNVQSDIDLRGIIFKDAMKLSFLSEKDGVNATLNTITYDCNASGKNLDGALLNLIKFTEASISTIEKTDDAIMPQLQLFNFKDCITVTVTDLKLNTNAFNSTLFSASGFDSFSVTEVTGELTGNTGTLCNLSSSGTEADINFINIKTKSLDKFCNIVGCDINEFNIIDSEMSLNKLISFLNSKAILFKFDKSTINFKENVNINLDTITLESSKLSGEGINFTSSNSINFSKSNINSKKLNINLKNVAKLSSSESTIDCKSINIVGQTDNENSSSKIDFVRVTLEGDECTFKSLDVVACNYTYIMSKSFIVENCKVFDSSDITVRLNKTKKLSFLSISDTKNTSFILDNGGTIDIESNKHVGTLKFDIKEDCTIRRKCIDGRFAEYYTNIDNKQLSIVVDSTNCKSSIFKVDKKYINIKPLCSDFILFKSIPEGYNMNLAGKEKTDYIYYGI